MGYFFEFDFKTFIISLYTFNNYFLTIIIILGCIYLLFSKYWRALPSFFFKKYILFSFLIIFFIQLVLFISYVVYSYYVFNLHYFNTPDLHTQVLNQYCIVSSEVHYFIYTYNICIDMFGLVLVLLAFLVGFLSLLILDIRFEEKYTNYYLSFVVFMLIVYNLVVSSNYLVFFLFYEFLLLPSFFFVYFLSSYRRSIIASLYFVIWTQIGSIIVFIAVVYLYKTTNLVLFSDLYLANFTPNELFFLFFLFFVGFGIKVPIWPFHYWLTKTHVEAPSGFSIYLSGFLVKAAIYGFYKFMFIFNSSVLTYWYVAVVIVGVVDASFKMWGQTDLKKLVAYATIQEMNLIYLVFMWGDSNGILFGILFCFTHAFLSSFMFFLVDCIYRRFHTRSIVELNGILNFCPNLSLSIICMLVLFSGLPGTMKFVCEFFVYYSVFESSPFLCIILMFSVNVIGLIGFSKSWFNVLFGINSKWLSILPLDLTWKEILIVIFNVVNLVGFNYLFFLVI